MFTSENLDAFISIAAGLFIAFIGFLRLKKPLPQRPGELARTPEEQARRARMLMGMGCVVAVFGVARLSMH